jgi:branched-chain amino acid transport system ATP-binding protein
VALLSIDRISLSFGGLKAVSEFSLELSGGELVGIIGPNGAGKTTVFNIISGVYRPDEGTIRLRDTEITGLPPHAITAAGIARTFQNIRLFNRLSVLDNIRVARYAGIRYQPAEAFVRMGRYRAEERRIEQDAREMLASFELGGFAEKPAGSLPYGHQRRLEIIRALATGAKLLLLDEPAAGMNPREIDELMRFIADIRTRFSLTVILIEHQMRLVMNICERLSVLDFGVTIAEGTPAEIVNNQAVMKAYLGNAECGKKSEI